MYLEIIRDLFLKTFRLEIIQYKRLVFEKHFYLVRFH